MGKCQNLFVGLLVAAFITTLSLSIYYGTRTCVDDSPKFLIQKSRNHILPDFAQEGSELRYLVFSDPQFGLYDVVQG